MFRTKTKHLLAAPRRWQCGAVCMWRGLAFAGPGQDPGDALLRHGVQHMSDAGVVHAPLTAWPLAWADVARDVEATKDQLTPALAHAKARVLRRYHEASKTERLRPHGRLAASVHPREFRTFESTPR